MRSLLIFALPAVLSTAVACGDDGGTPSSSGVEQTKTAGALSDAEAKKLCKFADAVTPTPSETQACTFLALFGQSPTKDKATCEAFVSACKAQNTDSISNGIDCTNANASKLGGCKATVAQIEECFKDTGRQAGALYQDISCSEAGNPEAPGVLPSCKTLQQECPQAFTMSADSQ